MCPIKNSLYTIAGKREAFQRGCIEELFWQSPAEVVVPSLENSEVGAITESWGDTTTEFVVTELKHTKGW